MIIVRGAGSAIAQELNALTPIQAVKRGDTIPLRGIRYLFCQGLLRDKRIVEQTAEEIVEGINVNFADIADDINRLIEKNDKARICVIGSESAWAGSYDGTYAQAKELLHAFVETKPLRTPEQQLICIAPGVIRDGGMCLRRTDTHRLDARRERHPKKRFLQAAEVAKLVHFVLCVDKGYLTGVVIRMNGGEHT